MDAYSETQLIDVHPELARRVRLLAEKCALNGFPIRVTCGERTWSEQDALYAKGRSLPGNIVTKAQGGFSAHQFGYAADIVPGKEGFPAFTADWDILDVQWKQVLSLAKTCGLAEGAQWRTFPDRPHLFLEELPATPTDEMRELFVNGGMDAVWDMFEQDYGIGKAI